MQISGSRDPLQLGFVVHNDRLYERAQDLNLKHLDFSLEQTFRYSVVQTRNAEFVGVPTCL